MKSIHITERTLQENKQEEKEKEKRSCTYVFIEKRNISIYFYGIQLVPVTCGRGIYEYE
jgi:hypothetical protein